MKISFLLTQRRLLQEQARLSNLAYALTRLTEFSQRMERAHLRGRVHLLQAEPDEGRYDDTLVALEGNQSVLEEHFVDRDVTDFVDAVAYATGEPVVDELFDLREMEERFLRPLRERLEKRGVDIDLEVGPGARSGEAPSFD
jgi:hypothetical protein